MQPSDKLKLYRSLFRGRDDVFSRRSNKKGAYFPDYTFNWDEFNAHRANGGTIKDFENKRLTPLTDGIMMNN
jgi:hypothetical protein